MALTLSVPAACEPQLSNVNHKILTDARLAIIIDLLTQMVAGSGQLQAGQSQGIAGVSFTSANASAAPAIITDLPAVGSNLVADSVVVSVDTAMNVKFMEETTGTVMAGPFYMPANSTATFVINRQLPTINKRLTLQTSVAGNIMARATYHSNP